MKNRLLLGLIVLALSGCVARNESSNAPTAPAFHRENDKAFSSQERAMIVAARRHLAQSDKRPKGATDDAYYRVRPNASEYEVFVIYVTGYDGSKPVFTPCVHNEVFLRQDGSVLKVLTGPECWPSR